MSSILASHATIDSSEGRIFYGVLTAVRKASESPIPENSFVSHLFKRGDYEPSHGSGNLFHARIHNTQAQKVVDKSALALIQEYAERSTSIRPVLCTISESGASGWMPAGWNSIGFINLGSAYCEVIFNGTLVYCTMYRDFVLEPSGAITCLYVQATAWTRTAYTPLYWYERLHPEGGTRRNFSPLLRLDYSPRLTPPATLSDFSFADELGEMWYSVTELGFFQNHRLSVQCAEAYRNAVSNLPDATCNTIANVLDLAGSLHSLTKGKIELPKRVGDAWLQKRYVVDTTKADFAEYKSVTQRLTQIASSGFTEIKTYGHSGDASCQVSLNALDVIPKDVSSWLQTYGVNLSLYNAWDMVPYSFVVDWFLHIGDLLEAFETYGKGLSLNPTSVWYSIRQTKQLSDTATADVYIRMRGSGVNRTLPSYSYHATSEVTLLKRVTDSFALVFN